MAANYALKTAGNLSTQMENTFGKPNMAGNALREMNGRLVGGRRRFTKKYKKRRGGNLPAVLGQAAAPFTILGTQYYYKKKYGKTGSFKKKNTYRRRYFK